MSRGRHKARLRGREVVQKGWLVTVWYNQSPVLYTGGGGFRDGNIGKLWEISHFKCVRNFPLNF